MPRENEYTEYDLKTQRELEKISTMLEEIKTEEFPKINSRLDSINGCIRTHEINIQELKLCDTSDKKETEVYRNNHLKYHDEYEEKIGRKVSAYSIGSNIVGACVVTAMGIMAWFTGLFER